MVRPRQVCRVCRSPGAVRFSPQGTKTREHEVDLWLDEYEAIRLKDLICIDQQECATKMGISQSTFHRLLQRARAKIADSIINEKPMRIRKSPHSKVCREVPCSWRKRRRRCCYESKEHSARDER